MNMAYPFKKLRLGAVSYLNTKPLVFGLDRHAARLEVEFDLPSRLADGLANGRYDVALIPSVEFFQNPTYKIVSDACIACRGPVWSVKLLSRVPMCRIQSLALDEGSRTSAALVRILLQQRYGITPKTRPLAIGADSIPQDTDAALLIGDRAMHQWGERFIEIWDLGEEWCRWAELPFVFAMWVARDGVELRELSTTLQDARDAGLQNLLAIAQREAPQAGLTVDSCLAYLRDNLYFHLGPRERQGLELFREHAARFGLAPCDSHYESLRIRHAEGIGPDVKLYS